MVHETTSKCSELDDYVMDLNILFKVSKRENSLVNYWLIAKRLMLISDLSKLIVFHSWHRRVLTRKKM